MQLQTTSQLINYAVELEDKSAKFYEDLAEKFEEYKETFLSFVKENKKNKILIYRTYNEVVTDAFETGFSLEGFNTDEYIFEGTVAEDASLSDMVHRALETEQIIQRFYLSTAEKSKSFLADISQVFERIAKKRGEGKEKLKSLL